MKKHSVCFISFHLKGVKLSDLILLNSIFLQLDIVEKNKKLKKKPSSPKALISPTLQQLKKAEEAQFIAMPQKKQQSLKEPHYLLSEAQQAQDAARIRKRKQKIISTGKTLNPKERLYCVCKKPYDETR